MTKLVPTTAVPRFVEFIRVSSKGQSDSDTPETQRRELDLLRERRPGILVERIDIGATGLSGAKGLKDRPDLQRLRVLAENRAFDEVRVYLLDRLSRADDPSERFAVYSMVRNADAIFVDKNGVEIDPQDELGEVGYYIQTWASAQERRKISTRARDGRKRVAAAGKKPLGRTLYGFTYNPDSGEWGLHQEHAENVRTIYAMAIDGRSCTKIAEYLTSRGVPSPSGASEWKGRGCTNI